MSATRPRLVRLEDRLTPATALVTFAEVVPVAARLATLSAADVTDVTPIGFGIYSVDVRDAAGPARLAALPGVLSATGDQVLTANAAVTPQAVDPGYANQDWLRAVSAPAAWTVSTGTGRTIVAVIDSGLDVTHPDLAPNLWTNPNETPGNGVDDDGNGFVDDVHGANFLTNTGDVTDTLSHGTHVAGVIGAASDNGQGGRGVNGNATILPLKFLGPGGGKTSDAVRAMDYAVTAGAKVINASWGGGGYDATLLAAIRRAGLANVVVVASAGNYSTNIDTTPFYPASYATQASNVVAVAAATAAGGLSSYSNSGAQTVTLAAPGDSLYSTLPGGRYGVLSGTSVAAPVVSGALSLAWDAHPDWTAGQIVASLRGSIDVLPGLAGKTATGGRVNVARLVGVPPAVPPAPPVTPVTPPAVTPPTAGLPAVATAGFSGSRAGQFDRVTVTFTRPTTAAAVTAAGVRVTGPAGDVRLSAVVPVAGTGDTRFHLMFSRSQTAAGVYTLAAGGFTSTAPLGTAATPPATPPAAPPPATAPRPTYQAGTPRAVFDQRTTRVEIAVPDAGTVSDIAVTLDLDHARPADLQLRLTAPDGRKVVLANRTAASLGQVTFRDAGGTAPAQPLATLTGAGAKGVWVLELFDLAAGVSGTLWQAGLSFTRK